MKRRKIYDEALYAHFVTFSCYHRRRLLDADRPKRMVLGVLADQMRKQAARCVGFVLMPDHVHAIVWFPEPGQLSRFMQGWKRRSSYQIREWHKQNKLPYAEKSSPQDPVWQRKYYAFEIDHHAKLEEKLDYMHQNPVRAGLVDRSIDWPWSSARWYAQRQSVGIELTWVD